jgi:hypothetical protein
MRGVNRMLGVSTEPQLDKVAQFTTTKNHGNMSKSVTISNDVGFQLPTTISPLIPQTPADGPQIPADGPVSSISPVASFSFPQVSMYICLYVYICIYVYIHI